MKIGSMLAIVGIMFVGITMLGLTGLYYYIENDATEATGVEDPGGTGKDYMTAAIWYDNPNGANWTTYTSTTNPNITFELPMGELESVEVYYPLDGEPKVHVGLYNDVNHLYENDTSQIDNMRTLTFVFEDPVIMEPKEDAILAWNLELLYKEDSLNVTVDDIETLNITVGENNFEVVILRIYHYENPNNRGVEARYFYSFLEPEDRDYEIFIAYSIVKNMTNDPTQWSDSWALEEAERVFESFTF